jgi:hypothetical protein
MCSATRSALAMMVSVGLTAPIDGIKALSTTYRLPGDDAVVDGVSATEQN